MSPSFAKLIREAVKLPLQQRMKLAKALLDSIPAYREPLTLEELEQRAKEVESGKVKPVSSDKFDAHIARLRKWL
jgi:putative addiction module component (TIGR02574 family)